MSTLFTPSSLTVTDSGVSTVPSPSLSVGSGDPTFSDSTPTRSLGRSYRRPPFRSGYTDSRRTRVPHVPVSGPSHRWVFTREPSYTQEGNVGDQSGPWSEVGTRVAFRFLSGIWSPFLRGTGSSRRQRERGRCGSDLRCGCRTERT